MNKQKISFLIVIFIISILSACTNQPAITNETTTKDPQDSKMVSNQASEIDEKQNNSYEKLTGTLTLDQTNGPIQTNVQVQADGLEPNSPVKLMWSTVSGTYTIENF